MFINLTENIPLHSILQNFSPFYICCIAISLLTVIFSWYCNANAGSSMSERPRKRSDPSSASEKFIHEDEKLHVWSQIKRAERKAIEKLLSEELTEEQLADERETEERQLLEIFELLKQQEDKFNIKSQDELQEQFRLYRSQ